MIDYKTNPMNKEVYSDNKNTQCLEHGTIDGFNYYIISYSTVLMLEAIFTLTSMMFVLYRKDRRGLHDMMSNTIVIKESR